MYLPDLIPEPTKEPLPEGRYYLVDISSALEEYLQAPVEVRMCAVDDGAPYTPSDMLDIELSAIVPVLEELPRALPLLREHISGLLEDGRDQLEDVMKAEGINTETRTILNSADQLDHAKLVDKLGCRLHDAFKEHKLYDQNGLLLGEHCTLLDHGILVLRRSET